MFIKIQIKFTEIKNEREHCNMRIQIRVFITATSVHIIDIAGRMHVTTPVIGRLSLDSFSKRVWHAARAPRETVSATIYRYIPILKNEHHYFGVKL